MIRTNFGLKIKEIRNSKLLSQDDLSSITNIDRAQISKIEKGKANVTLDTIEKLANALNVAVQELLIYDNKIHPFVKWAGGKTQIINKLMDYLPKEYNEYYEPFVGGGALLFSLKPSIAHINDFNSELICAYKCFKDNLLLENLKCELRNHEKNHCEEYYYEIREKDKDENFLNNEIYVRAGRLIYLNKSCFNGLYRVNSKGFFNVPFGKKDKVNCFEENNFDAINKYFISNNIFITNDDFEKAVISAKKNDFVYFDPPYDVFPDKTGFVDYGKNGFGKDEQIRLNKCFKYLSDIGVKVMLSNHNTPFINELYKGFNIHVINAKRIINSKADGRGDVEEVIITNY